LAANRPKEEIALNVVIGALCVAALKYPSVWTMAVSGKVKTHARSIGGYGASAGDVNAS